MFSITRNSLDAACKAKASLSQESNRDPWWSLSSGDGQDQESSTTLAEEVNRGDSRLGDLLQAIAEELPDEAVSCRNLVARLRCTGDFAATPLPGEAVSILQKHFRERPETGSNFRVRLRKFQKAKPPGRQRAGSNTSASSAPQGVLVERGGEGSPGGEGSRGLREITPGTPVHSVDRSPRSEEGVQEDEFFTKSDSEGSRSPFFPPAELGNLRQRCFVLFDDATMSICGKLIAIIVIGTIAVSTLAFVMESMPEFRETPADCVLDALTLEDCEPRAFPIFAQIEVVCIAIFTVDYIFRVCTVHAVPPSARRSGLEPGLGRDPRSLSLMFTENLSFSEGFSRTWNYARQPLALVDLLAIVPFYVDAVSKAMGQESVLGQAAGILRLMRVLRLLKLARGHKGMKMYVDVMRMSGQPLLILMFFDIIIVVLFGTLMYYAEGTEFSVAAEWTAPKVVVMDFGNSTTPARFPTGVLVRMDAFNNKVLTPFTSIPRAIWWVCVTMTTVGYGDFVPTTNLGKVIGIVTFYIGVVFLALPISVLGRNFDIVYTRMLAQKEKDGSSFLRRSSTSTSKRPLKAEKSNSPRRRSRSSTISDISSPLDVGFLPRCTSLRRSIFLVADDPSASRMGKYVSLFMLATILVSTLSFMMETMPSFRVTPDACAEALTVENCKPVPDWTFLLMEKICIVIFTIDYVVRMGTVHAVEPEEVGMDPVPVTAWRQTLWYMRRPLNLIDLFAIAPFYIDLIGLLEGGGTGVLRVLRLVRVFRVLKMPKLRACAEMFIDVAFDALPALAILLVMTTLTCVFFSSCMFIAEGTQYTVTEFPTDRPRTIRPTGLYIRPTKDGYGIQESPFRSIPYTFWWFFTTATTVGFGDDFPTTTFGRLVAVAVFCTGIILLAMPITIVGGSFSKFYSSWVQDFGDAAVSEAEAAINRAASKLDNSEDSGPPDCDIVVTPPEKSKVAWS
mmetsp:Transcript_10839/g.27955  ORF Transcript_10839/g.27955 Transcript_10839/m.27955 type:complete len:958 (-) Transcript_10839:150-3023(-)